jgi:hypothetical protein
MNNFLLISILKSNIKCNSIFLAWSFPALRKIHCKIGQDCSHPHKAQEQTHNHDNLKCCFIFNRRTILFIKTHVKYSMAMIVSNAYTKNGTYMGNMFRTVVDMSPHLHACDLAKWAISLSMLLPDLVWKKMGITGWSHIPAIPFCSTDRDRTWMANRWNLTLVVPIIGRLT